MKKISEAISLIITGAVMILGFQNCGSSTYSANDLVENTPLSSVHVDDTRYKEGLSFNLMSKTNGNTVSEFRVQKKSDTIYSAQDGLDIIKCSLEDENPMRDLTEISDNAKVTHPSLLPSSVVCETAMNKLTHFKIGEDSPVYLIAMSQYENCLMDDPQTLLDEGKRVFIIENIYFEEIENLVDESRTLSTTESCTVNTITLDE